MRVMKKYIQPNTDITIVKGSMNLCMVSGETGKTVFKPGSATSGSTGL